MNQNWAQLYDDIQIWAQALGFDQLGVSDIDLAQAEMQLQQWLAKQYHGDMGYMARHGSKRSRPEELVPDTLRVICVRMNYLPEVSSCLVEQLNRPHRAYISRYALGRDYHKVLRKRLAQLAKRIETAVGDGQYRVFVDSAPVLEKPLAVKAGLGWQGKHTNLLSRQHGSYFFLGEIYTNLPLPIDTASLNHCGRCHACLDICPTQAIVAPYQLDARRCISYLTIELHGSMPLELRPLLGNRIYGCDDCQIVCPWNRFAQLTKEADFFARHELDSALLVDLFAWDETDFLRYTEGSAIRRLGYERWLRNLAVALGNAPKQLEVIQALQKRCTHSSSLVQEHVMWALKQHEV